MPLVTTTPADRRLEFIPPDSGDGRPAPHPQRIEDLITGVHGDT